MCRSIWPLALALTLVLLAGVGRAEPMRIAVSEFQTSGTQPELGSLVAELLAMELAKFEGIDVITPADLRGLLDQAVRAQLLGCEEPSCFVDVGKALAAPRLLTGSVSRLEHTLVVSAAVIDMASGQATARASQPLPADDDALIAGLKAMAVVLVTGDAALAPGELVAKGEVTSQLLERVRIGQRDKGLSVHLLGGGLMAASALASAGMPPSNLGGAGRVQLSLPLLGWLQLTGGLGGGYYSGAVVQNEAYARTGATPEESLLATGSREAGFGVADLSAELGVRLRPAYGLVLPYLVATLSADWLILDVSDLEYHADPDSPDPAPEHWTAPVPFRQSMSPGVGFRLGSGVDFMLLDKLGLGLELSLYGKWHGLELISMVQNVEQRVAFAPLAGVQLMAALFWQF